MLLDSMNIIIEYLLSARVRDEDGNAGINTDSLQPLNPSCWVEEEEWGHPCGKQTWSRTSLLALGATPHTFCLMVLMSGTGETEAT